MKWVIRNIIFLLGTCLVVVARSLAQGEFHPFRFEHITVNEGLPHSDALSVAQDQAGFIWVGTNKGVVRYDGYSLKKYNLPLNDQQGVSGNRVRALHVDPNGRLWVGVERAGLYYYDAARDRFASVRELAQDTRFAALAEQLAYTGVYALCTDSQQRLWASSQHEGLFVLETERHGSLRSINQIRLATPPNQEPTIYRLAADNQDKIWIGTLGYGLWVFDARRWAANPRPHQATKVASFAATNVRTLHLDRRGDLWIGSDGQISWAGAQERSAGPVIRLHTLSTPFAGLEKLFLDSFNRLWVSTNYGLLLMDADTTIRGVPPIKERPIRTFLPRDMDPGSINSVRIHDILEDRFHNLWFATSAGGLNQLKLRAKPFGLLRRPVVGPTTVADNYINAIHKDEKSNRLWLGTRNGFASYDCSRGTYQNYLSRSLSGTVNGVDVSAFHQAKDGTLWVGTRYHGLYTMKEHNPATLQRLPDQTGLPNWAAMSIESIVEDRNGTIWVATINQGIHAFSEQGRYLSSFNTESDVPVPTQQVTMLYAEPDKDILWASTSDAGVLKLQIGGQGLRLLRQFKHEPNNPASLRTNYAWPLLKDKQGTLWIGTIGGGLHRLVRQADGREVMERYSQWVPETDIESLLMDESGHLWIGGSGLYQFNPATKELHQYDVSDGLQSNSFKVGAAYRSADGTMYFGGTNGITFFQPQALRPNPSPPLVHITGVRVLNEPVEVGDTLNGRVLLPTSLAVSPTIKLKASENDFTIEFVGLNYAHPQKQQYAYRLEGYDEQWVKTTADRRMATFANLPAGDYTFYVKASNDDGLWATEPATLHITILPPWWKTWWAYLLYIAFIGGTLYLYHRYEMRQQELKNKLALEQYKVEKEKEVTDTKLQFFTNISHELRTPLTLILGPMEELASGQGHMSQNVKAKMMLMHQQTRKLLDLVNQLLEFRKVETGSVTLRASQENVTMFLTELYLIFKLKAEELGVDYAMEVPSEAIPLYFDRHKLEIVLTNLLSNAFKYTPAGGKIRVQVEAVGSPQQAAVFQGGSLQNHYLQIVVQDGGVGVKAEELDKIFDPYYQASHTGTLRIMGTGVGLSLVKQLVEAHSGQVLVQSEVGVGTCFTVRLPFGKDHLLPEQIREETAPPVVITELPMGTELLETTQVIDTLDEKVRSARVLLVEDNDELRQYIQQLISPTFEVFLAVDGIDGWEKALDLLPDLIISDIMMPRSDGLELCRKVKQHPKTGHIPVVLLTARTAAMHELEGLETGADEYMAKPFNPRLLYTKIAVMLQNRFRLKEYYQRQILLQPTEIVIPDEEKQLLEKAMHIVESQLGNADFSIPVLVREMGMSQSALYRQIKAITGQSVIEFIRDIRLKQAAKLLATTHLRISEVASMVGFNDLKYFRKIFQELYELSPSEYAKQRRGVLLNLKSKQDMY